MVVWHSSGDTRSDPVGLKSWDVSNSNGVASMLQPKTYPELLGKALVFEAEPFVTMVDDDNPWAEGLFMVVSMGVLVGLAQIVGALLTAAVMPQSDAMLNALLPIWREISALGGSTGPGVDAAIRQWWPTSAGMFGIGWSWAQLSWIILAPLALIVEWLLFGLVAHVVARILGGRGTLTQTLGASALMVAPQILVLVAIIPFASVSIVLVFVWSILIVYRAVEVAHDLSSGLAAAAALVTPAMLILLFLAGATIVAILAALTGGMA